MTGPASLGGLHVAHVSAEAWEELGACPVCESADALCDIGILEARELGAVTAACLDCEHGFMRRRPAPEWFDAFYASIWDSAGRGRVRRRPPAVVPSDKVADFCAPHLPPGSGILDVGAGFGQQLLGFRTRGFAVEGIEASEHRAAYVSDVLGIPCSTGTLESHRAQPGLRLVAFHHVLEHLTDPAATLAAATRLLPSDGFLYIAVPNLWHEHSPQTFHFVPHLSLFTLRSLKRLLRVAGFDVVAEQEDRELQVIAMPREGEAEGLDEHERFETALAAWASSRFGPPGRRLLAWCKSSGPADLYDTWELPDTAARRAAISAARAVRGRLPARASGLTDRVLPRRLTHPSLRTLPVAVEGNEGLPVTIRHDGDQPPVWVK